MLVTVQGIAPITTSPALASGLGVQPKNVLELVRKCGADLKAFDLVRFEIAARPAGRHGRGDTEFAILNE
jgi:hypothetical protein